MSLQETDAAVRDAIDRASAQLTETARIRAELANAEVAALAEAELNGTPPNLTRVEELQRQLEVAVSAHEPTALRLRVEELKHTELVSQIADVSAAVLSVRDRRDRAMLAALGERLADRAAESERVRRAYLEYDLEIFAIAKAFDNLAVALKAGVFVGSQRAIQLCLPIPDGHTEVVDLGGRHVTIATRADEIVAEMRR